MPLIEELPVTGPTRVSHGWAYVPDTGPIAAMALPGSRKRNRNDAGTTNATATAKQQKAVQQRLESLDKENYKDNVSVPIPTRTGANARESKIGKKTTSNVRRILTYQRTFQHYLADEEAGIGGSIPSAQPPPASTLQRADSRRKSGVTTAEATPVKTSGRSKRRESAIDTTQTTTTPAATPVPVRRGPGRPRRNPKPEPEDVEMPDAAEPIPQEPATQQPSDTTPSQTPAPSEPVPSKTTYDPSLDSNPLLRTLNLPAQPSLRVMQLLLSEPPLTYTAARAKPLVNAKADGISSILTAKPPRHFCALCGYWGKVKCRKCGEWTCGLMECWKAHEGVCVALGMY